MSLSTRSRLTFAALAVVAAGFAFDLSPAQAQVSSGRNPWCLRDGPGGGRGSWDCSYRTFEQCNYTSRNGVDGSCTRNPEYRGGKPKPRPRY